MEVAGIGAARPGRGADHRARASCAVEHRLHGLRVGLPLELRHKHARQDVVGVGVDPGGPFVEGGHKLAVARHERAAVIGNGVGGLVRQVLRQAAGVAQQGQHAAPGPGRGQVVQVVPHGRREIQLAALRQVENSGGRDMLAQRSDREPTAAAHRARGGQVDQAVCPQRLAAGGCQGNGKPGYAETACGTAQGVAELRVEFDGISHLGVSVDSISSILSGWPGAQRSSRYTWRPSLSPRPQRRHAQDQPPCRPATVRSACAAQGAGAFCCQRWCCFAGGGRGSSGGGHAAAFLA